MKIHLLVLPLSLLASASGAARTSEITAILLQVEGTVTVTERSSPNAPRARPHVRRARPLQVVRTGDALRIPPGARVGLVCSTDHWLLLVSAKGERRLDDKACSSGRPLPPGVYRSLVPEAGRLRSIRGAVVLERRIRGPEEVGGRIPVLLEPRNSAVLEGRPVIRWTRAQEATEYLVEMTGDINFQARLEAADISCDLVRGWGEIEVCSAPYPQTSPEIPPGALVYLTVAARRGTSPWYQETGLKSMVRRLSADRAATVRERLRALADLPVSEIACRLLEANLYVEEGLVANALSSYRDVGLQYLPQITGGISWQVGDTAEILVTLGDTYLEIGLLAPAVWSYELALRNSGRPLVVAAAGFGLGRIEYTRRNFERAYEHFVRSRVLYAEQGLTLEALAAERAAAQSKGREAGSS